MTSCQAPNHRSSRARPLLGTLVEIAAEADSPELAHCAIERAFNAVHAVHTTMSYQSPTSELTQLNRQASRQAMRVSQSLWQVLCAAWTMAEASDGLFDVTVAPALTRLGYLQRHAEMPRADRYADWRCVHMLGWRRVRFVRPLRIDLSGIAKGYAVDRAVAALRAAGARAGRVNAGGDLRVFGVDSQMVQVRHPAVPGMTLPLLELREGAVATSANYYTVRRRQGRDVSPLLGPDRHSVGIGAHSVTVQAADCMTADALTKVVHADAERALPVLNRFGARALLLRGDPDSGACRIHDSLDANRA